MNNFPPPVRRVPKQHASERHEVKRERHEVKRERHEVKREHHEAAKSERREKVKGERREEVESECVGTSARRKEYSYCGE